MPWLLQRWIFTHDFFDNFHKERRTDLLTTGKATAYTQTLWKSTKMSQIRESLWKKQAYLRYKSEMKNDTYHFLFCSHDNHIRFPFSWLNVLHIAQFFFFMTFLTISDCSITKKSVILFINVLYLPCFVEKSKQNIGN